MRTDPEESAWVLEVASGLCGQEIPEFWYPKGDPERDVWVLSGHVSLALWPPCPVGGTWWGEGGVGPIKHVPLRLEPLEARTVAILNMNALQCPFPSWYLYTVW